MLDNPSRQELGQSPTRPATLREETAVAGGIAGNERSQSAQQIGDGVSADGQQCGGEQESEAQGSSFGEDVSKGIAEEAYRSGQLVVELAELSSDGACLAGLPLASLGSLGFGEPLSLPFGYTR